MLVAGLVVVVGAAPASAHPLGNFTVNRYARVEVSAGVLRVHYVLDEAEIPAFQDRREVAAGPQAFAAGLARRIGEGLRLALDGQPVALSPVAQRLSQPAGQGGLRTLRLAVTFEAPLPAGSGATTTLAATFDDTNEPARIGWREVVVVARGDARLLRSDAPARDVSDELRAYPDELLAAPLDHRRATFSFVPGAAAVPAAPLTTAAAAPARPGEGLAGLVDRDVSGVALAGLLALAFGFGAVHALGPGHGKTVMAAYLVGTRGRPRDAVALGGGVSLMHTASVLVLALALLRLDRAVAADRLYPWLTLASGVLVALVGSWLLARRWRDRAHAWPRHHHHHHDHGHGAHHHDHHREPAAPLSRRGLVALAASGGLFPSPTAVLVLLSAFSLHRAGLGLALVAAFSAGLAATLTAVGLVLVYGRGLAERRGPRLLLPVLPLLGASALVVAGTVLAVRGAAGVG
ncbi:MAG: nickel/cobalt transporter [Acidimicrobiales bacterium]